MVRARLTSAGWHGDAAWSERIGRWEWAHHAVFTWNPAAWNGTAMHRPWINVEWGWQAILAAVGFSPALWGLLAVAVLGLTVTAWWAWAPVRVTRPRVSLALGAILLCFLSYDVAWTFRPMLLSLMAWSLLIGITLRARTRPRWWLAVPPLAALWANLHGDFLLIFAWLAFEAAWAAVLQIVPRSRGGHVGRPAAFGRYLASAGAGALAAVVLATPHHWQTLTYSLWLSRNPWIHRHISEWQPPVPHWTPFWMLTLAITLGMALRYALAEDRDALRPWWIWSVVIAVVSLSAIRYIVYLGVPLGGMFWSSAAPGPARPTFSRRAWGLGVGLLTGTVLVWGHPSWPAFLATTYRPLRPVAAWLNAHPHPGLVYFNLNYAGVLEQLGVAHLYADGRVDFFLRYSTRPMTEVHWMFHPSLAVLHTLRREGVTRLLMLRPTLRRVADLRAAHWRHVLTLDGVRLWQAPPSPSSSPATAAPPHPTPYPWLLPIHPAHPTFVPQKGL